MSIDDPKTIFQTSLTQVATATQGDLEQAGTIRHGHDGKIYRWVYNTIGSATVVGSVVCHDGATDTTTMYNNIEENFTNGLMFMAGVCISVIPIAGYGWIQIDGTNPTINNLGRVSTAIAVGDSMIPVNSEAYCAFGAAVGAAPIYTKSIIILETVATATTPVAATVAGLIKCFT